MVENYISRGLEATLLGDAKTGRASQSNMHVFARSSAVLGPVLCLCLLLLLLSR